MFDCFRKMAALPSLRCADKIADCFVKPPSRMAIRRRPFSRTQRFYLAPFPENNQTPHLQRKSLLSGAKSIIIVAMLRADLIRSVKVQFENISEREAADITDSVFEFLKSEVAAGNRVELRGLGIFEPKNLITKMAFNPKSGKRIATPASKSVKFKPSGKLIKEMNRPLSAINHQESWPEK